MLQTLSGVVFCLGVLVTKSTASHEAVIPLKEINLVGYGGLAVNIKSPHENPVIEIQCAGKKTVIDRKYLPNVEYVLPASIEFCIRTSKMDEDYSKPIKTFYLLFSYGPRYSHGEEVEGKEVEVRSMMRLYFQNGVFQKSKTCFPSGEFKNQWRYRTVSPNGVDEPGDYFEESVRCPWERG